MQRSFVILGVYAWGAVTGFVAALVTRAVCEADGVRDDLRRYVTDHLRHADAFGRR